MKISQEDFDQYGPENFMPGYRSHIQAIQEFYLGRRIEEPDVATIRSLYTRSALFKHLCDDDDIVRVALPRLFRIHQHEWDAKFHENLDRVGQEFVSAPSESEGYRGRPGQYLSLIFFCEFWTDPLTFEKYLEWLKIWLAQTYRNGGELVRKHLVTDILAYLFDQPDIVAAFSDWQDAPLLQQAYLEAVQANRQLSDEADPTLGIFRNYWRHYGERQHWQEADDS